MPVPVQEELAGVYAEVIELVNCSLCQHAALSVQLTLPRFIVFNSLNSLNPWLI